MDDEDYYALEPEAKVRCKLSPRGKLPGRADKTELALETMQRNLKKPAESSRKLQLEEFLPIIFSGKFLGSWLWKTLVKNNKEEPGYHVTTSRELNEILQEDNEIQWHTF